MISKRQITSVQGTKYSVWSDYITRCTFAENVETGERKAISTSGYLSKDLSIRKAIASSFGYDSFKK